MTCESPGPEEQRLSKLSVFLRPVVHMCFLVRENCPVGQESDAQGAGSFENELSLMTSPPVGAAAPVLLSCLLPL